MDQPVVGACGDCFGLCDSPKCRLGHRKPVSEACGAVKCAGIVAHLRLGLPHRLSYEQHTVLTKVTRNLLSPTPDKSGGLNGSTQHLAQTHLALKTKAKIAR